VARHRFLAFGHFYGLPPVRNSYLLVDFFFVLSGFVTSHATFDRLGSSGGLVAVMIRRFGRAWPLHAFMLGVLVAFPLLELPGCRLSGLCRTALPFDHGSQNAGTMLSNLLLVHSLGLHDTLTWNWPSWSISTEFYTYALLGVSAFLLGTLMLPFGALAALACALVIAYIAPRHMDSTYDFGPFRFVMGFMLGFLAFRLYRTWQIPRGRFRTGMELAAVVLVAGFLSWAGHSAAAITAPLLFAACAFVFAHEQGRVSSLLKTTPFLKLGEWSYSIYMVHAFLLIFLLRAASAAEKVLQQPVRINIDGHSGKLYFISNIYVMDLAALLYLGAVIALAGITYRRVEVPARAWAFADIANKAPTRRFPRCPPR